MDKRLDTPARVMRIAVGLMATLAGLDKFFNILVDWSSYVSPTAAHLLPTSPHAFMGVVGVIEFAVGISILTALPVLGAYVASAWLLLVAGNLAIGGFYDIAVRDVVLSLSAFTLARLTEVRQVHEAAAGSRAQTVRHPATA